MADLRAAILNASLEADRMHRRFDSKRKAEEGEARIDVFDMLVQSGLPVMFQRLNGLLGAFLNVGGAKGVIVTTQRPLSVQRFTAAHELGHAMLGHEPSADPESILYRYPVIEREAGDYTLEEIQANVFASQLLMPRWLIARHMRQQGWTPAEMAQSDTVYQLSLRLGVSYSAACHALLRNQIITGSKCDDLVAVQPKTIKKRLVAEHEPDDWRRDVWVLTERDDKSLLEGSRSDMLLIKVHEHSGAGYEWQFDGLADAGFAIVFDELEGDGDEDSDSYGGAIVRTVLAEPSDEAGAEGHAYLREARPWETNVDPIQSLRLDVDLVGPLGAGLHRAQRKALLGVA
jgi:Zn-dependent peptidase ImmA (M78 family)